MGSSISWEPRLMKRRSLIRIFISPSCVDMSTNKKIKKYWYSTNGTIINYYLDLNDHISLKNILF
jgi:hypothetical protein